MTSPGLPLPELVTAENLTLALRRLDDLALDSEQRASLRTAVLDQLGLQFESHVAAGDLELAAMDFETAIRTHTTEEILAGEISPVVTSMASVVRTEFSPRGDEARVMVALLVLRFGHPDDDSIEKEYQTLVDWTEQSREALDDDALRVNGLASLYEQVAMAIPVPAVTDRLLDLYSERQFVSRAAYDKMLGFQPSQGLEGLKQAAMAVQAYEQLQPKVRMTSYLVARLFTRLGTPTAALAVLDQGFDGNLQGSMQGQVHEDVVNVLEALDVDPGNPSSWLALSRLLAAHDDLELARWAARKGWKVDPWGHTFALELGRLYKVGGDLDGAEEYMDLALSLDPDRPLTYQELIGLHLVIIRNILKEDRPADALASIDRVEQLLGEFRDRWPDRPAGLKDADVTQLRGFVAFEMGKPVEAAKYFEKALESDKEIQTIYHLGLIHAFTLRFDKARETIAKAQKINFAKHGEAYYWKTVLGALDGDILHFMGRDKDAQEAWREAIDTGVEGLPFVATDIKPEMEAHLALLLLRIGRTEQAIEHLKRSIASGASESTYSLVLAQLTARGDVEVGDVFYHYAATDSNLSEKTKLDFALWDVALHWRAGIEVRPSAVATLEKATTDEWPGQLYGFAAGKVDEQDARASAGSDLRRLVKLDYMVACKLIGQGNTEEAATLLRAVIATGLVADPNLGMALETLHSQNIHF
jgi:tetratricopeptide (TPR) repeat protein